MSAVALVSANQERDVAALHNAYCRCLDTDRIEEWPGFFVENAVYKVLSRENIELGLPAPLIYYYSRGMMEDRVTAIRDALTFEPVYTRHLTSGLHISAEGDTLAARSDFAIYQTTEEGVSRLFSVGEYRDRIVVSDGALRFSERVIIMDSFGVQNLIAIPL
jgi:anthranilate 1,2-dioxygenase small subunit